MTVNEVQLQQFVDYLKANPDKAAGIRANVEKAGFNDETSQLWRAAFKRFQDEVGVQAAPKQNEMIEDIMEELDVRAEHFDKHHIYLDRKEYNAAMDKFVKAGGSKKEFREDNTLVKNKKVKEYIQKNFYKNGVLDEAALKQFVKDQVAGDYELNFGIHKRHQGNVAQSEREQLKLKTNLTYNENEILVKAAGARAEKSDKAGKVLAAAGKGAAIGAGVGAAVGSVAGLALDAAAAGVALSAEAKAGVIDLVTGQVIAGASDQAATTLMEAITGATGITSFLTPGGLIGAAIGAPLGAAIGAGIKAMTYHYDGKHDMMNHNQIADVVKDPSLMTQGLDGELLECARTAEFMLYLVKAAGVSDDKIVDALKEAGIQKNSKGERSGSNINCHEFAAAMKALFEKEQPQALAQPAEEPAAETQAEEPATETQEEKPAAEEQPKPENYTVTVKEGEGLNALAKKYGVTVQELTDLNKDALKRFRKKDCSDYIYGFLAGATIKLPPTANKDAVEKNNATVKPKEEIDKYGKRVWSDTYINKYVEQYRKEGKMCEQAILHAGGQALLDEVKKRIADNVAANQAAEEASQTDISGKVYGQGEYPKEQEAIENLKKELDRMNIPHNTEDYGELLKLYQDAVQAAQEAEEAKQAEEAKKAAEEKKQAQIDKLNGEKARLEKEIQEAKEKGATMVADARQRELDEINRQLAELGS